MACRKCGSDKVAPSRARRGNWICSPCNNERVNSDPARYLARKQLNQSKVDGKAGTALVRQVLVKYCGKSALSGESNWKRLCIVRIDRMRPWTQENAVLVTLAESYALSSLQEPRRTATLQKWMTLSRGE
jgi:hypothetical protein